MEPSDTIRGHTTVERTIVPGAVLHQGTTADYRRLEYGPGEPHLIREELCARRASSEPVSLAFFAHLTDIQLCDSQSPVRLEMLQHCPDDPSTASLRPAQRPYETLAPHAATALVGAINSIGRDGESDSVLQLVITTGDMIDNAQENELRAYLSILSGGKVVTDSGGDHYEGMQDGRYRYLWQPDTLDNAWSEERGFPLVPGLITSALRSFESEGLSIPWLACYGNHDNLLQGRVSIEHPIAQLLIGGLKPDLMPQGIEGDFIDDPLSFFTGRMREVTPNESRRAVSRGEFLRAHFKDGGLPEGHGFTEANLARNIAYFVYDEIPGVRVIVLDSTTPGGDVQGSLDRVQFEWLENSLITAHARYLDAQGRRISTEHEERLVIIVSHHPREHMNNTRLASGEAPGSRVLGDEVAALLQRFPNVIAWIAGHVHRHSITPHGIGESGYWEITTASIMEWPSQIRLFELFDNHNGTLSLLTTVVDHDGAIHPGDQLTTMGLASWHRELSSNDPFGVGGAEARGSVADRNTELLIADPRVASQGL